MLKEKFESLKSLILRKDNGNNKRKIENLIVFLIILVITVISINIIWNKNENNQNDEDVSSYKELANSNDASTNFENNEYNLEEKLKNILSKINGVGNVEVLITYQETSELIAMYNENVKESSTEETDTSGGKRVIQEVDTSKDIVYQEESGKKMPITQKVVMPKMEGAIIIAEGANDSNVRANIIQAVEAATGLLSHKIQVFEMKNDK